MHGVRDPSQRLLCDQALSTKFGHLPVMPSCRCLGVGASSLACRQEVVASDHLNLRQNLQAGAVEVVARIHSHKLAFAYSYAVLQGSLLGIGLGWVDAGQVPGKKSSGNVQRLRQNRVLQTASCPLVTCSAHVQPCAWP